MPFVTGGGMITTVNDVISVVIDDTAGAPGTEMKKDHNVGKYILWYVHHQGYGH